MKKLNNKMKVVAVTLSTTALLAMSSMASAATTLNGTMDLTANLTAPTCAIKFYDAGGAEVVGFNWDLTTSQLESFRTAKGANATPKYVGGGYDPKEWYVKLVDGTNQECLTANTTVKIKGTAVNAGHVGNVQSVHFGINSDQWWHAGEYDVTVAQIGKQTTETAKSYVGVMYPSSGPITAGTYRESLTITIITP